MGASASIGSRMKKEESDDSSSDDDTQIEESMPIKSPAKKKKRKKKHSTFFTEKELQEIKAIEEMQRKATAFISKHFYYGVPVIIVRQSVDPYSPVFVQPDANLALERVHAQQLSTVRKDWDVIKSVPTTVMVNCKGNVVVCFDKTDIKYEISIGKLLDNIANNTDKIIDSEPPVLTSRTQTSLTLRWDHLPDPPGLSQYVDVQYSRLLRHKNKSLFHYLDKTNSPTGIYDIDANSICGEPWLALVSKAWDSSNFTHFCFDGLAPGASYVFRLRYRNHRGWSEYSAASRIYRTEPGPPAAPVPPLSDAIMPHAVHLRWAPPPDNNGAVVESYVLEGRAVGDSFTVLFSGMRLSFVVFNLFPHAGYNFQVKAVNSVGTSAPSTIYSILTPEQLHAPPYRQDWRSSDADFMEDYLASVEGGEGFLDMSQSCYANAQRCRDAWATHYDLQTNQMFYFNVLTGSRQLHMPNALLNPTNTVACRGEPEEVQEKIIDEVEIANEKKKAFRSKRFRFIRDVHVNRKQKYKEVMARHHQKQVHLPSSSSSSSGETLVSVATPYTLPVKRDSLLSDTYKAFSIMDATKTNRGASKSTGAYNEEQSILFGKLTRKLRILFHQEAGIDVGGLSKEFYLLLSEQMAAYMGKRCRNITRLTESGKLFFNEDFCEEAPHPSRGVIEDVSPGDDPVTSTTTTSTASTKQRVSLSSLADMRDMKVRGDDFCQFFGRLTGKAIYDQQMLTMPLSSVLLAHITGFTNEVEGAVTPDSHVQGSNTPAKKTKTKIKPTDIFFTEEDLADLDSALFKSLKWIKNNNTEGIIDNTFTVVSKANKTQTEKEINLCKNGDQIDVTESNKLEYVKLLEQWKTTFSVSSLLTNFLEGFWEIIPVEVIQDNHITKSELDLIMNGKPVIDVEEIRAYTIFQGEADFSDNHPQVIQLWQTVREFEEENKRLFLFFVTGTSRVPLDGYDPPFNITQGVDMQKDSLPRAHTCFNQLVMPCFSSLEVLKEKLLFAIKETEGFQLS